MDSVKGKVPPSSIETEKSVLGACLLDGDALLDVLEILKAEDFYSENNKEIFSAIESLYRKNEPVDSLTLAEELKKRKSLEAVGGRAFVMSLADDVPTTSNVKHYAKIISDKAVLRKLIKTAGGIQDQSFSENAEPEEVLDKAEQEIFEIGQKRQKSDYTPLQEILFTNMETFDRLAQQEGEVTGLTTGFTDLDAKTSGLQKSNLIIVAARPAMGKTAFALNIALNSAKKVKASVLVFSLEMDKEELGQRLIAIETKVEMQKLKNGNMDRRDWERIQLGMDELSDIKIHIDDTPGISIMEMKNKCRRLKAEKGLDLVVVDYLQLMSMGGRQESRQLEIAALSRSLKLLAREMDCPVIVLSQLSRAPEQRLNDKRPMLADLRDSGAIEQDADMVMFLYRDDYYNEDTEEPGVCEVIVAKHRSGPTGTVKLTWIAKNTKFADKSNIG